MYKKLFIILLILSITTIAFAQQQVINDSGDILVDLQKEFIKQLRVWITIIERHALFLFLFLGSFNILVRMILLLIEGADLQKTISFLVKYLFITGIFFYFLQNGVALGQALVNSFLRIAYEGSSVSSGSVGIESILSIGWDIVEKSLMDINEWSLPTAIVNIVLGFATYFVLLLIVASYIIEILSIWILVYLGYFLLAFGGSEWTREIAVSYIKAILSGGMRLLTIIFMTGVATELISNVAQMVDPTNSSTMIYIFTISLLLLMLMTKLPNVISNMILSAWGGMGSVNRLSGMAGEMSAMKMGSSVMSQSMTTGRLFKAGLTDQLASNRGINNGGNFLNTESSAAYQSGRGAANLSKKLFSNKSNKSPFNDSKNMSEKNNRKVDKEK